MDPVKLDELIASAKSLQELGESLVKATQALKDPAVPTEDTFTQKELDAVLAEVDELKVALTALKA